MIAAYAKAATIKSIVTVTTKNKSSGSQIPSLLATCSHDRHWPERLSDRALVLSERGRAQLLAGGERAPRAQRLVGRRQGSARIGSRLDRFSGFVHGASGKKVTYEANRRQEKAILSCMVFSQHAAIFGQSSDHTLS